MILPTLRVGKVNRGFVLLEDVLVRMWAPHGDPTMQIVLPFKFRTAIIQTMLQDMWLQRKHMIVWFSIFLAAYET